MGTSVKKATKDEATALRYFSSISLMRLSVLYEIFGRDVNLTRLFFAEKSMFTIAPDSMNRANVIVPASEGVWKLSIA